ncbi:MAG: hypothetical protein HXL12_02000 [Candidatus Nanosynbacter sp.]|nr:hypothetical protein [Candidatus Nanosynbacter sp.]
MKKSFKKFLAVFMLAGLFVGGALSGSVFAKTPKSAAGGASADSSSGSSGICPPGSKNQGATNIAACNIDPAHNGDDLINDTNKIINVVIGVLGVVAVAVVIYGGFLFLTAQGDPGKIKKGKDSITWGIIGLIIALLSWSIINFVLSSTMSAPAAQNSTTTTTAP